MGRRGDDLAEVAAELERLAERLADLALDRLRAALDRHDPDPGAAEIERRITRARTAVHKAVGLLEGAARTEGEEPSE